MINIFIDVNKYGKQKKKKKKILSIKCLFKLKKKNLSSMMQEYMFLYSIN